MKQGFDSQRQTWWPAQVQQLLLGRYDQFYERSLRAGPGLGACESADSNDEFIDLRSPSDRLFGLRPHVLDGILRRLDIAGADDDDDLSG